RTHYTGGVWRIGHFKDFSFSQDGDLWAFAEPAQTGTDPVGGAQVYLSAAELTAARGTTPVWGAYNDIPTWATSVDNYLSAFFKPFPKDWHRVAIDVLLVNHGATPGTAAYRSYWQWVHD